MANFAEQKDIEKFIRGCSPEHRRHLFLLLRAEYQIHALEVQWNVTAEIVLEAIARSSALTQRMFKGIIAEAACKVEVIDRLRDWVDITESGDKAYDFKIKNTDGLVVTIQAKLQRKAAGAPLRATMGGLADPNQYVVETQKTRKGKHKTTGHDTRPYRFGEFDILAVAMEPSTHQWKDFRFTVGRWLIPRVEDKNLLQVYQPVSPNPNEDWTDDLGQCIEWFKSPEMKTIRGKREIPSSL